MTIQQRLGLGFGTALALLGATCAPVQPPVTVNKAQPVATTIPADAEVLHTLPAPQTARPRTRIEAAIDHVRQRDLLKTNGFWTIFHGILGLGPSITLREADGATRVIALDYIAEGGALRGLQFIPTRWGLDVQMGPLSVGQGHQDQFVAEMGQWGMPAHRKFQVNGQDYTFMDFVRQSQMRARTTEKQELSWAIIVIGQYLGTDLAWTNAHDEKLHFEDLLRYELDSNVEQAACGGTHRLFGLAWAYQLHAHRGGDVKAGVWREIAEKTAKYRDLARQYQNADGSFSTDFFRGRGNAADRTLRVNSTGHTLEWLALALSDAEIKQPWVEDAANSLAIMILDMQDAPIDGGSLYHAVHGLLLYYARVHDASWLGPNRPFLPQLAQPVATK